MLQYIVELRKLRVICTFYINSVPVGTHGFENLLVSTEHFNESRIEIFCFEYGILRILFCLLLKSFLNLIIIKAEVVEVIDVKVRSNEHTVILEHVDHVLIGITESTDTCLAGIK